LLIAVSHSSRPYQISSVKTNKISSRKKEVTLTAKDLTNALITASVVKTAEVVAVVRDKFKSLTSSPYPSTIKVKPS